MKDRKTFEWVQCQIEVKGSDLRRSDRKMLQRTRGRGQIQITEDVKMVRMSKRESVWDKRSWGVSMGAREQSAILGWKESSHLFNDKHVSGSIVPPPALPYLSEHGFTVTDTITHKHLIHHFGNSSGNVPYECQVTLAAHTIAREQNITALLSSALLFSFNSPGLHCLICSWTVHLGSQNVNTWASMSV